MENKKFYSLDNNDCLTAACLTIYENSFWCIKLFFKSLWQILLLTKEELPYTSTEMMNSIDILSINNSAGENYSEKIYQELPRNQRNDRRKSNSNGKTLLSNKTRVIVRSLSNENINRAESNQISINPTNTLGTINSHIIVVPVDSSHCQNMTTNNDFKSSENINLREELADVLCRRSYEPLTFLNRGMCCGHCRPIIFPNHYLPSITPQQVLNQETELSQQSRQIGDVSETQSTPSSASPENEPLSTGMISQNEQNHSIFSFPEHETSPSQESEVLIANDNQFKVNAQILVDDSMQNAQEKYQEILRMNTDQNQQNTKLDTTKQIIENQSKLATTSSKPTMKKLSDNHTLCQQLCNKLNLSDSNQITEIIHILASNAPHILKQQQPSNKTPLINHSNINKDNENTLGSQLLLHPPFKPKRLIHLYPDGSIQVLSAVDEHSNEKQIINQEQFRLDYSNSALTPDMQQNQILTNESSLGLVDVETNFNHMMFTESTSTQQSHSKNAILLDHLNNSILTLQQKKTLPICVGKDNPSINDHLRKVSQENDPIVKIDLDLNDEENSKDDDNALPEIFFKRIIVPEHSLTLLTDDKQEMGSIRRKNHHNRSRSSMNKKKPMNSEK